MSIEAHNLTRFLNGALRAPAGTTTVIIPGPSLLTDDCIYRWIPEMKSCVVQDQEAMLRAAAIALSQTGKTLALKRSDFHLTCDDWRMSDPLVACFNDLTRYGIMKPVDENEMERREQLWATVIQENQLRRTNGGRNNPVVVVDTRWTRS